MTDSDPCPDCGDDWVARHILPLDEEDSRGDEVVRVMHGEGRHCTIFRSTDGGTHE